MVTVNSKISRNRAETAIEKLVNQIKNPKWVTGGIGIGQDPPGSYVIIVYVDKLSDKIRQAIPMSIDDVPIQLSEVGKVKLAES